jgi:hypothetical protein
VKSNQARAEEELESFGDQIAGTEEPRAEACSLRSLEPPRPYRRQNIPVISDRAA